MSHKNRKIVSMAVGSAMLLTAIIVVVTFFVVYPKPATSASEGDATTVLLVEDRENNLAYGYSLDNNTSEPTGYVYYDAQSLKGINYYREFNRQQLETLIEETEPTEKVPLKIVFTRPLSEIEFREWVQKYPVTVDHYYVWLLDANKMINTISSGPEEGVLIADGFDIAIKDITQRNDDHVEMLGWIDVTVLVEAQYVPQIAKDSRVYMIDVMRWMLNQRFFNDETMKESEISWKMRRDALRYEGVPPIGIPSPLWKLYELGLLEIKTMP